MTTETASPAPAGPPEQRAEPRAGLVAWLVVAGLQVAIAFLLAGRSGNADSEPLYEYDFAIGSIVIYGVIAVVTFWIASAYRDRRKALGLTAFAPRWLGTAAAVIVASVIVALILEPVLHAGEEQGLSPDAWRPERATAFLVNAIVVTTIVPFTEELFFRGLGVRALGALGGPVAVAGTAVLFGLAHGILVALPPLVFFALGLAWVRLRSGSVWPGVIAHAAYNGIGIAIAYASIQ